VYWLVNFRSVQTPLNGQFSFGVNNLDELGCLDLLADFGRVIVPQTV